MQRRRRERRCRIAPALFLRDADGLELARGRLEQRLLDFPRGVLTLEAKLLDLVAFVGNEPGCERLFILADVRFDRPVLARLERFDLEFALDDHAQRGALYSSRRQAGLDLLPQQR